MTKEEAIAILEEEAEFLYGEDKPHNRTAFDMAIKALSENKCFEGMTNGEVFQSIFPCDVVDVNGLQEGYIHFSMKSNLDSMDCFSLEWWNAPYKAESEVKPNEITS